MSLIQDYKGSENDPDLQRGESCDSLQWPGKFRCQQPGKPAAESWQKKAAITADWRKRGEIQPSLPGRKNIMA